MINLFVNSPRVISGNDRHNRFWDAGVQLNPELFFERIIAHALVYDVGVIVVFRPAGPKNSGKWAKRCNDVYKCLLKFRVWEGLFIKNLIKRSYNKILQNPYVWPKLIWQCKCNQNIYNMCYVVFYENKHNHFPNSGPTTSMLVLPKLSNWPIFLHPKYIYPPVQCITMRAHVLQTFVDSKHKYL